MVESLGKGIITEQSGPLSFKICLDDGRLFRRHQDHLRLCDVQDDLVPVSEEERRDNVTIPIAADMPNIQLSTPNVPIVHPEGEERDIVPVENMRDIVPVEVEPVVQSEPEHVTVRRSGRVRQQPAYMKDYISK